MKKNMSRVDTILRWVVAAVIGVLFFTGQLSGTVAIILGIIAGIFLLTGVVNFCPLYALFGISTCSVEPKTK